MLGPVYFNFELDIYVCKKWNGKDFREISCSNLPTNALKVRHIAICDYQLKIILGSELWSVNVATRAKAAYRMFIGFERLETILVLNTYGTPRQSRPWKMNILKDTDAVVQERRGMSYELDDRMLLRWRKILKKAEAIYPGWKAPKINHLHFECVDKTVKRGDVIS
jgi:hypothetical protein